MKQQDLPLGWDFRKRKEHGGELSKGKRKLSRPLDCAKTLHLVLRSSRARGKWAMDREKNAGRVFKTVYATATRFGIKIHQFANVGNHLHLLVQSESRLAFQNFLRTMAALISRAVTAARKGNFIGSFWDYLAYSRVVSWGRDFKTVCQYIAKNQLEALGVIPLRGSQIGMSKQVQKVDKGARIKFDYCAFLEKINLEMG